MKSKDVWTIPLTVAALLLIFAGALSYTQRVRVRGELSTLLPEMPVAVLRVPALRERLPHLLQSAPYQQLRQAAVWQELLAPLTESLHDLNVDPMRVIGADALVSLHQRPDSGGIPAVLVLSRMDWLAKKAEQIAYVFDCFFGKIGIRVAQSGGADAIYQIQTEQMRFPIYYATLDDVALLCTSLPLLKKTVARAIHGGEPVIAPLPPSETRIASLVAQPLAAAHALAPNPFFALDEQRLQPMLPNGWLALSLDALPEQIVLNVALSPEDSLNAPTNLRKRGQRGLSPEEKSLAASGELSRARVRRFMDNLNGMLPELRLAFSAPEFAPLQAIAGDRIVWRLLKDVQGTLYAAPDLACAFEIRTPPQTALSVMQQFVARLIERHLPPAQRTVITPLPEPYRGSVITKMTMLFQEIFCYAVVSGQDASEGIFAATSKTMKREIDRRSGAAATKSPDFPAFAVMIQSAQLADFLNQLARTNTFQLLVPKHRNAPFYEAVPTLLGWLNALPPMRIDGDADGRGVWLSGTLGR